MSVSSAGNAGYTDSIDARTDLLEKVESCTVTRASNVLFLRTFVDQSLVYSSSNENGGNLSCNSANLDVISPPNISDLVDNT